MNFHENYSYKPEQSKITNLNFGLTFASIFFLMGILQTIKHQNISWLFIPSVFFFGLALKAPEKLSNLNKYWMLFGFYLKRITSPAVLLVIFFLIITPIGLILKFFRKDILDLNINKNKKTYWILSSNLSNNMKDQF